MAFTTADPMPLRLSALSNCEKRQILADAVGLAHNFRPTHPRSNYDVTSLAVAGSVRVIFVQDAHRDGRRRRRSIASDATIAAATGTTRCR